MAIRLPGPEWEQRGGLCRPLAKAGKEGRRMQLPRVLGNRISKEVLVFLNFGEHTRGRGNGVGKDKG